MRRVSLAVSEAEEVVGDTGEAGTLGGDTWKFLPDVSAFHFSKNVSWPCQSSSHRSLCFTEESTSSETSKAAEQPGPAAGCLPQRFSDPCSFAVLGGACVGQLSSVSGRLPPAPLVCRLLALEFLQDLYLDTLCHTRLRLFRHIHSLSWFVCSTVTRSLCTWVSPAGIHCFGLDGSHGFAVTTVASSGV